MRHERRLTVVELAAELVVRAALDHLGHVLGLLVNGHGPDDSSLRRRGQHLDLDGTRLGDLAVELLQICGVLGTKWRKGRLVKCLTVIQRHLGKSI